MKTFVKMFVSAAIIASLYSCNFFGSDKPKEDPKEESNEQPIDTTGKIDTLGGAEGPAKDTGVVTQEEAKEEVKK